MEFARDFAGKALVEGYRGVDVCQAYLIMAVYPVPKKKWAEDRSWLLMGVAIRMAIELELNQPPPTTCDEREALDRVRTWLNCYCVDGSHAIQFGKMPMLHLDDYLARNSSNWHCSSPFNTQFDVHLCAYVQMILHMAKWRSYNNAEANPVLQSPQEIIPAAFQTQEILAQEMDIWRGIYAEQFAFMPPPICSYRGDTTQMITAYLRLVVLLGAFQHIPPEDFLHDRNSDIFFKSIEVARSVIDIAVERLYPTGFLRYAMDANFLYVSFAAAFLINLFRPRYSTLLDDGLKNELPSLLSHLIAILGSNNVALDGRHTPALYSRFLSSLMRKHRITVDYHESTGENMDNSRSPQEQDRQGPVTDSFPWPDISTSTASNAYSTSATFKGAGHQTTTGWLDMDFSLSHFIKTVTETTTPPSETDFPQSSKGWDINYAQPTWTQSTAISAGWDVMA